MKLLLTGFEAFLDVQVNISQVVLDNIDFDGIEVHKLLLPVSYERSFNEILKKANEVKPELIIMMGVARKRTLVSLEKIGTNRIHPDLKDNDEITPSQEFEIKSCSTNFDILKIINSLSERYIPFVEESLSAGTYVCNSLYYNCLDRISKKSLFIHLPGQNTVLNEVDFIRIIKEIVIYLKEEV